MKKTLSIYKITLLLYVSVFLLPLTFYFNYQSLKTLKTDTLMIGKFTQVNTDIFTYLQIQDPQEKTKLNHSIEREIQSISPWFNASDNADFYVGGQSLREDFTVFLHQWNKLKEKPSSNLEVIYSKNVHAINFTLDKMMLLKHNHVENIFFIHIVLASIFLLLLIYFTRTYINFQINKASVYDKDTKLFSHSYFESQLKVACAKLARDKEKFSVLSIYIDPKHSKLSQLNKKTRKDILERFGDIILSLTRVSDISCRCEENLFVILLSEADETSTQVLETRIKEKLESEPCMLDNKIFFVFNLIQCKDETSPENVLVQIQNNLN